MCCDNVPGAHHITKCGSRFPTAENIFTTLAGGENLNETRSKETVDDKHTFHTRTNTSTHTHAGTHARTHVHTHIHKTNTHIYAHRRTRTVAQTHTQTNIQAHTHTRTHARTHAHTHTHTHIYAYSDHPNRLNYCVNSAQPSSREQSIKFSAGTEGVASTWTTCEANLQLSTCSI